MSDQILLAKMFSEQKRPSLFEFIEIQKMLKSGMTLNSIELWQSSSYLVSILNRYSLKEKLALRDELEKSQQRGVKFTFPGHHNYPKQFLAIEDPPFLLRYIGNPVWKSQYGLAVVGSREPAQESLYWMEEHLGKFAEAQSGLIISGGARGVDLKAHQIAIRNDCPTVAFVPSGLDKIYPESFSDWVGEIVTQGGAICSEFDDEMRMQKSFFQQRNRLISGMSVLTLIVEARRRSGSMITAHKAVDQGRPVLVVPGHPSHSRFHGSLDLLLDGATLVTCAEDLNIVFSAEVKTMSSYSEEFVKALGLDGPATH